MAHSSTPSSSRPSIGQVRKQAFVRALRRRCPQCGEGPLFVRFARLAPSCEVCGLVYRREQGAQTGSMYLTAAVGQVFACLVIGAAWIFTDWSVARFLVIAVPVVSAFCVWFLPLSQALWVAVEYGTDAANGERWVEPR